MNIFVKMVVCILISAGGGCAQIQSDTEATDYSSSVYSNEEISKNITDLAVKIKKRIESNWVQPESATNGMVVRMNLRFYPDGSVRQSKITEGSGSEELDISALDAVKRSEPFREIKDLSGGDFQRYFSVITFHFMVIGIQ